jgi:hypothetical protein
MKRLSLFAFAIWALSSCTGPQLINMVHPDHPPELQRVNTPERAETFFADTTLFSVVHVGQVVLSQIDESSTAQSTSTYFVTYLAPGGRALATTGDSNGIIVGHWRIEARPGRSYPRICTAFLVVANAPPPQPDSDSWSCRWPSELLRANRNRNQVYRGDVLGLADGHVPAPVRAQTGELDITMFWNAQPRRPENLLSLLPNQ